LYLLSACSSARLLPVLYRGDQRVKLRPIIDKYSQKIFDIREINRSQMDLFIDSLRIEVTPILTAEQIEALERARQEMQRHRDSDRSRR